MSSVVTIVGIPAIELARTINGRVDIMAADAADVFVDGPLDGESRARLANAAVDFFIQPAAGRCKRVLLADMESTLIENEFLDDLAEYLGLGAHVKAVTKRGMEGGMDFQESLQLRMQLLKGAPVAALDAVLANWRPSAGVQAMMAMLKSAQIPVWLVSSGFTHFTQPVGKALGCVVKPGNAFIIADGRLTGDVATPIKDKHSKRATLDEACTELGLQLAETAAVGDGANDLLMLQAAGAGFGFRAKPAVAAAAPFNIRHSDLRAIAFAFGLKQQ